MRKLLLVIAAFLLVASQLVAAKGGTVSVRGYYKANGTYVAPYHRTAPDSTKLNNWSTIGNVNPYTGKPGTVNPYPEPGYSYSQAPVVIPSLAPSAMASHPTAAAPTRQFVISDQGARPLTIPPGARVTTGAVYKYTRNGITNYTTVPPSDVGAKVLFTYIEVGVPPEIHYLYRCLGSSSRDVVYSRAPVPNMVCKTIGYSPSPSN